MPTPYSGVDNFPTSYNIPSDGDTRNAASVDVALEALGDRTTWLKNRVGDHFLRSINYANFDDTAWPPTLQWTSSASAGSFTHVTDHTSAPISIVSATVPSPGTTDVLFFDACFTVGTNDSDASVASDAQFEWQYQIGSGANSRVLGTRMTIRDDAAVTVRRNKVVTLTGHLVTVGAGVYNLQLFGCSQQNTLAVNVVGAINLRLWHYAAP